MARVDFDNTECSLLLTGKNASANIDPAVWTDVVSGDRSATIAQAIDSSDRTRAGSGKGAWRPDQIFLGIDVTSSMSEQPLSGMSQLNSNCAGDQESVVSNMSTDSRAKLEQLKDVLATFVSGLDDVRMCKGRIFGLSVDPQTHDAFFDSNKNNSEQSGLIFGDGQALSRKQIVERIRKLEPKGPATAVASAIDKCRLDAEKSGCTRPLLALWTDGQENCGGNVCEEIEKFASEFPEGRIIVFGLDPTVKDQFDCVGLQALGDRFQFVDAHDPNKSLEVLGKMSNNNTHGELVNKDVNGTLQQEELRGKALPLNPSDEGYYGEIFGQILRRGK